VDDENVEPAGFWIRGAARLIDWIPNYAAGSIAGLVLALVGGFLTTITKVPLATWMEEIQDAKIAPFIGGVIGSCLYHAFSESVAGATLGKRLLGLEVVGENLAPATLAQTLKRDVAFFVDALFFGLIAYGHMKDSPEKQRLGDEWGKTRVVMRRSLPPHSRRPTALFICVFLAAMGLAAQTMVLVYLVVLLR